MDLTGENLEKAFKKEHEQIEGRNPFHIFMQWFEIAKQHEINDPDAMALATVDTNGLPNVRMVLLKDFDETGFVFYTNTESQKGLELAGNMQAAAVFHWKSLGRQIRLRGSVRPVSDREADVYYASRPRASRIGAWASRQSKPLESRMSLKKEILNEAIKLGVKAIPRPPFWSGFRISPSYMEFWLDRPFRLHDRLVFQRKTEKQDWEIQRLYP